MPLSNAASKLSLASREWKGTPEKPNTSGMWVDGDTTIFRVKLFGTHQNPLNTPYTVKKITQDAITTMKKQFKTNKWRCELHLSPEGCYLYREGDKHKEPVITYEIDNWVYACQGMEATIYAVGFTARCPDHYETLVIQTDKESKTKAGEVVKAIMGLCVAHHKRKHGSKSKMNTSGGPMDGVETVSLSSPETTTAESPKAQSPQQPQPQQREGNGETPGSGAAATPMSGPQASTPNGSPNGNGYHPTPPTKPPRLGRALPFGSSVDSTDGLVEGAVGGALAPSDLALGANGAQTAAASNSFSPLACSSPLSSAQSFLLNTSKSAGEMELMNTLAFKTLSENQVSEIMAILHRSESSPSQASSCEASQPQANGGTNGATGVPVAPGAAGDECEEEGEEEEVEGEVEGEAEEQGEEEEEVEGEGEEEVEGEGEEEEFEGEGEEEEFEGEEEEEEVEGEEEEEEVEGEEEEEVEGEEEEEEEEGNILQPIRSSVPPPRPAKNPVGPPVGPSVGPPVRPPVRGFPNLDDMLERNKQQFLNPEPAPPRPPRTKPGSPSADFDPLSFLDPLADEVRGGPQPLLPLPADPVAPRPSFSGSQDPATLDLICAALSLNTPSLAVATAPAPPTQEQCAEEEEEGNGAQADSDNVYGNVGSYRLGVQKVQEVLRAAADGNSTKDSDDSECAPPRPPRTYKQAPLPPKGPPKV